MNNIEKIFESVLTEDLFQYCADNQLNIADYIDACLDATEDYFAFDRLFLNDSQLASEATVTKFFRHAVRSINRRFSEYVRINYNAIPEFITGCYEIHNNAWN